jgi:hypothetical protein
MAMVDAALKRLYWPPSARRALLVNAYTVWFAAWALVNDSSAGTAYWGYFRLAFDIPGALVACLCAAVVATTAWAGVAVARAFEAHIVRGVRCTKLPWNGALAYVVTLYLWTLFAWVDVAYLLVIPFFHSLQYLAVVWRYKTNELSQRAENRVSVRKGQFRFALTGVVLGALGFWLVPGLIDYVRLGDLPKMSGTVAPALACAWVFINIHHYLIDNVLWRQGNPNVSRYLFQSAARPPSAAR